MPLWHSADRPPPGRSRALLADLIAAAYRAQGDALLIESQAKMRLADEVDAAREADEIAGPGRPKTLPDEKDLPTAAEIGLSYKEVHEARELRNAERADPGLIRRAIDERVNAHQGAMVRLNSPPGGSP